MSSGGFERPDVDVPLVELLDDVDVDPEIDTPTIPIIRVVQRVTTGQLAPLFGSFRLARPAPPDPHLVAERHRIHRRFHSGAAGQAAIVLRSALTAAATAGLTPAYLAENELLTLWRGLCGQSASVVPHSPVVLIAGCNRLLLSPAHEPVILDGYLALPAGIFTRTTPEHLDAFVVCAAAIRLALYELSQCSQSNMSPTQRFELRQLCIRATPTGLVVDTPLSAQRQSTHPAQPSIPPRSRRSSISLPLFRRFLGA